MEQSLPTGAPSIIPKAACLQDNLLSADVQGLPGSLNCGCLIRSECERCSQASAWPSQGRRGTCAPCPLPRLPALLTELPGWCRFFRHLWVPHKPSGGFLFLRLEFISGPFFRLLFLLIKLYQYTINNCTYLWGTV